MQIMEVSREGNLQMFMHTTPCIRREKGREDHQRQQEGREGLRGHVTVH